MPAPPLSALVPWWLSYFPLLAALGAGPYAYLWTRVAVAVTQGRPTDPSLPWQLRARLNWPSFEAARQAQLLLPAMLTGVVLLLPGPISTGPSRWGVALLAFPLALVGTSLARRPQWGAMGITPGLGAHLRGSISWLLISSLPMWSMLAGVGVIRACHGAAQWVSLGTFLVVTAAASSGAGVFVARALGLVRPGRPALLSAAIAAAKASGNQARFVWELDLPQANAFALPWLGAVTATPRICEVLTPVELEAILCHELGHLREPRIVKVARLSIPVALAWTVLSIPMVPRVIPLPAFCVWGVAVLGSALLFKRVAKRMEHRADSEVGVDAGVYARALETIYRDNRVPAVLGKRLASHPDLYDRMAAKGHPPAWPRPDPPVRRREGALIVMGAVVIPLFLVLFAQRGHSRRHVSEWSVAISGGHPVELVSLARSWVIEGKRDQAGTLLRGLAARRRGGRVDAEVADLLAEAGFCHAAEEVVIKHQLTDLVRRPALADHLSGCREGEVALLNDPVLDGEDPE